MKTTLKRLRPRDLDWENIKQLAKEGRLFAELPKVIDKDACRREILAYTQAIDCYAAEIWSDAINELWEAIVCEDCLLDSLTMKNGLHTGHMNRYVVTNLVCRLQNAGVYRQDVSMLELHRRLEGISTRNRYYKSSGNYDLSKKARALLKKLISRV